MGSKLALAAFGLATTLCGCAVDRGVSYMPEILKQAAPKKAEVE
jgi:hypothetical protein